MPIRNRGGAKQQIKVLVYRCGIALGFVSLALGLTLLLQRLFPCPFLFLFFAAVMASAWLGKFEAGLFAVLLSTAAVDYFYVPPLHSFRVNATAAVYFVAFIICAVIAGWISASVRSKEEALRKTCDQFERDAAERNTELIGTQAALAHLSRVLGMGELTSSIIHEIGQPLTAIAMHAGACAEWLSANPPNVTKARQSAQMVVQEGDRAGVVINRVRALFRKEAPTRIEGDLNETICELLALLHEETRKRQISLELELAVGLPKVKIDRVQIQQVVLNLVLNAMDAMSIISGPKRLKISSRQENPDEILVSVEDSGVGVDPAQLEKIFAPFFSTKSQGMGLGLTISRSIVEAHEGRLWASHASSGGTVFQFTLPIRSGSYDA